MGIGVILGAVVVILGIRLFGSEFFEPGFEILMKAHLVIVNKNTRRYVHRIDEAQALVYAAFG